MLDPTVIQQRRKEKLGRYIGIFYSAAVSLLIHLKVTVFMGEYVSSRSCELERIMRALSSS